MTDIEIAQAANPLKIGEIAQAAGVDEKYLEQYGNYKAKVDYNLLKETEGKDGKLILVTAINPTPAGEGKTTTTVGLADGLKRLGKKVTVALREPSLGPVFGVKGGAAGGGYAQVIPMEDINLHFTGDFHAIGAANNLLAAMLDNHIYQGNALRIDPKRITWKRVVDMNDRQLRNIVDGLGRRVDGVTREDGYDITVASEIMAVLCLARNITDLKERLSKIIVGYTYDEEPVTAGDLKAAGAMTALLKDALKPNLVQTLEHTPAFIHGGPFANIAHGCNSVIATKMALKLGDYTITEAGFGADLGAEKFLDIKCRMLLPKEVNEEGEEEDPREELVQKLLEYKMYKYMSYELKDYMDNAAGVFYKNPSIPDEVLKYREPVDPAELLAGLTLEKLNNIYQSILKKQESKIDPIRSKFGTIEKEEVSLSDKMLAMKSYAAEHRKFSFRQLLTSQSSRVQVIVTFLSILELMKMGYIHVQQDELFDDIQVDVTQDPETWTHLTEFADE